MCILYVLNSHNFYKLFDARHQFTLFEATSNFSIGCEINIPVMPLFWNLSLNSDVVFWPQIRSGFVAEKTDTFDCRFV
jgi:hypothetical protein